MKAFTLLFIGLMVLTQVQAQSENIGAKIEELTMKWDEEAEKLGTYEGLGQFCAVKPYREGMVEILRGIHHYDSILYQEIAKKARFGGSAELKKTLKDIDKLAKEFSIREFLTFLHEECNAMNDIERNARKTGDDPDSQAYLLETELRKYVKHVTKRIDVIREHVHHLNIK